MDSNNTTNKDKIKKQEMLNALADSQLPAHEREEILSLIDKDAELSGDLCEIYRIKDLIKTAYPLDDFNRTKNTVLFSKYATSLKIACFLFAFIFTLGAGYLIGNINNQENHENSTYAKTTLQKNKVIVFLSSSEPAKLTQALYKAETLAQKYQKTNGEVYVVTSAEGIDLLNRKTTPFEQKIMELSEQYPSLKFIACNNTLYQQKKAGNNINLIANAKVVPSAVDFVAKHLQKGWQYITI